MSKGLRALERVRWNLNNRGAVTSLDLDIIEKELKEYEEMKRIKGTTTLDNTLEETLIKACPNVAKKLKALEIIKKYIRVDKPFGSACYIYLNDESEMIPEKEFDLLKEVLL